MAKVKFESVDEYIAAQPPPAQDVLQRVRGVIRRALPRAEEVISYQIPAYKQDGRVVVYFAGWKAHYSIYPASAGLVAALADDLAPYEVEKGTIRFPLSARVPAKAITRIAKHRAEEVAGPKASASAAPARAARRPRQPPGRSAR